MSLAVYSPLLLIWTAGVPQDYSLDCLFSTGLSDGRELITKWVITAVPIPDINRMD